MTIQTRNVTVNLFDNNGLPLENARVVIRLVGLGNEPGGAVSPGEQEQYTDENGQTVFVLWENNGGYSNTYYEVQSWNPTTGRLIHRRDKFRVPSHDADLEDLLALSLANVNPNQELLDQVTSAVSSAVSASESASGSANSAAASAMAAVSSASSASSSAAVAVNATNSAAASAVSASNSEAASSASASSAASSAVAASASQVNAASSESSASQSATDASHNAEAAAASALSASSSASTGESAALSASESAANAASSASAAASSASASAVSAGAAAGDASSASSSAASAANSAQLADDIATQFGDMQNAITQAESARDASQLAATNAANSAADAQAAEQGASAVGLGTSLAALPSDPTYAFGPGNTLEEALAVLQKAGVVINYRSISSSGRTGQAEGVQFVATRQYRICQAYESHPVAAANPITLDLTIDGVGDAPGTGAIIHSFPQDTPANIPALFQPTDLLINAGDRLSVKYSPVGDAPVQGIVVTVELMPV